MLRLHLPPNLAAAAARDAVALRVELDLTAAPAAELLPVLALLQRWCGAGAPPKFIQLSRAQLRELAAVAAQQPLFVENGHAGVWRHADLVAPPAPANSTSPAGSRALAPLRRSAADGTPLVVDGSEHFLSLTLPSREHPRYADALALVKENGFVLEPSNRKWWLRDRHKTLNFLATHGTRLRTGLGAEFTANFEKNTTHLHTAEIATVVAPSGDDFSVTLALQAGSADEATLRAAVASNRGYLESGGRVFLLDAARLAQLATAQRTLAGDPTAGLAPRRTQKVSAARVAEAQEIIEELSPGFQPPEAWKARSSALRNLTALAPAPIPETLNNQLRAYQRLGVAWLWHLQRHALGGILADEMGLGKTLQALGLLSALRAEVRGDRELRAESLELSDRRSESRPVALNPQRSTLNSRRASLVVCPASLLENWRREAARFAPQLRVFVHHGDHRLATPADAAGFDLIITSYGTLARDQLLLAAIDFGCVIADEAQHIKNRRSQNAAALRALRAHARFLLTGTPVENSLDDLRSLFEFLLPGYLTKVPSGLRGDERAWFDQRLRAQTAPYILRRTKKAVAPELPEKLEHVIWCELAPAQARLYRETQESSERELFDLEASGASEGALKFAALTQLLRLRQICCDPRLIEAGRDRWARQTAGAAAEAAPAYPDSAKLDAFNELLAEAVDDGHRVLVFSQFTALLGLLRPALDRQEIAHCYLDGSMPTRARQAEVDRFQASADIPVFLLSLKAGGTGLNLTGADTVVHFDPWWNPAAEAQATDRAHRIGQKRTVTSYKLIASGTVEEKVLALQTEKRALLADVFEASDAVAAKLSLADLKSLLQ
ncbi:DEAD/DEAH box helicase [Horticoccus sp. 23ND18S-11]|uniref:DEAD/DEAH box helicase n=1 Tax=Horticoccus sp. 23ND18S-11 TaxID=3391832 RepID=UPI0039C99011